MKKIFIIALLATGLVACKKENKDDMPSPETYPYTSLVGHTFEGPSYADSAATLYYQFLHIKSDTTVGVYTGLYDGSVITASEITYPLKINRKADHHDSFTIIYPGFGAITAQTGKDTTKIEVESIAYWRVK